VECAFVAEDTLFSIGLFLSLSHTRRFGFLSRRNLLRLSSTELLFFVGVAINTHTLLIMIEYLIYMSVTLLDKLTTVDAFGSKSFLSRLMLRDLVGVSSLI
jgi:hypothetical protein